MVGSQGPVGGGRVRCVLGREGILCNEALELTLACEFDSVCACWDTDGLAVVVVLLEVFADAFVGVVFEVGHGGLALYRTGLTVVLGSDLSLQDYVWWDLTVR